MAARIFAVLSAVFLVAAVAIAALTSSRMPLGQGLLQMDAAVVGWLQGVSPVWVYNWIELPFLSRPAWLLPACLGLVCAGLALTFNLGKPSTQRRRRS